MPAELHEALVAQAKRQGVSLNTWMLTLLATGYGFKLKEEERSR